MKTHFLCLAFVWLLSLKESSAVTSGLDHNLTTVTAGGVTSTRFSQDQQTMQQMSNLDRQSETSGLNITPSTIVDVKTSMGMTQASTHARSLMNTQTAGTPIGNRSHDSNDSLGTTTVKSETISTPTMFPTHEASNPTTPPTVPPMVSNPSQTQSTGKISTSRVSRDETTSRSSPPTQSIPTSTVTASIKPKDQATSTHPVTGGDAARPSTTITHITKPIKDHSDNTSNHSKIVAGLIGGALSLMMVGFLVIYIKKRQFQKQQTTTDWAGPSPFLSGEDNSQVTLRSSNRISLSSFLPQRLSKRLSLLPEMDKELQDMTPSKTFEGKHQENTFGQAVDGKDAQAKNGSPAVTQENGISETNNVQQTNNSEAANLSQGEPEQPSNPSGGEENAQAKSE
ncbi:protein EVI2B [Melanotaenia boesemani]|uniref:protein EVI2B n=1 Tax=Melanotaenia boesemani TaxID=1250792 RepID=UPI001C0509B8|nr:protein EVI2B [Melanotaenia boesemani]